MIGIRHFVITAVLFASRRSAGFTPIARTFHRQFTATTASSCNMLQEKYFDRLGFTKDEVESLSELNKENLDRIIEAHLANITFDNLSQHGLPYTASLDMEKTKRKIIDERRGGFCFELNGLLGELLLELGYTVKRVPAIVHSAEEGFRIRATHLVLIVSTPEKEDDQWFCDVGFGEPAINSLRYELDAEQETPEGMVSRLVNCQEDSDSVILEWNREGEWLPRLKWVFDHPGQVLSLFREGLDVVLGESSIFYEKLIVCKIDRNKKVSLAGNSLKITSPRFGAASKAEVKDLETPEAVQKTLEEMFHVPNADLLDLEKSKKAEPGMWSWM